MNTTRIEKLAVSEVEKLFLENSSQVSPNIEEGDKGISFDGDLIIFSDEEEKKSSYLGKIPVQVKGTEVESLSDKKAKFYDFDKETYMNFQLEDGVVVFLVEILKSNTRLKKVFYKFLDVMEIQKILDTMKNKKTNQRVIELELIDGDSNLNNIFYNIALHRKLYGYEDAIVYKYKGINEYEQPFEQFIVEKKREQMNRYEYQNDWSYLNKQLRADFENILSKNIYFDSKKLALVVQKIHQIDKLEYLPTENRNMANVLLAMYEVVSGNITESKKHLNEVDRNLYGEYVLRIELEYFCRKSNKELFCKWLSINIFDEELIMLYELYFFLTNSMYDNFIKLYRDTDLKDNLDYRFLYGKYLMLTFDFVNANEVFRKLFNETNNLEIQMYMIQSEFSKKIQTKDFTEEDFEEVLAEINELEKKLNQVDNIVMPALEDLKFQIEILCSPEEGLDRVNELLQATNPRDEEDLMNKKMTLYMELERYEQMLKDIELINDSNINNDIRAFKLIALFKLKRYEELNDYIDRLLTQKNGSQQNKLYNLVLELYLLCEKNNEKFDVKQFENKITRITYNINIIFSNLSLLEEVRKEKKSFKYQKNFKIIIQSVKFLNDYELERLELLLINLLDEQLTKKVYEELLKVDEKKADEICISSFFYLNKSNCCENILHKYKNSDLSEKLLLFKVKYLFNLREFQMINDIYRETTYRTLELLDIFLSAKIHSKDRYDVENISGLLFESKNNEFQINASIAFVEFGIDFKLGIQFFEKLILKTKFENSEYNQQFVSLFFRNLKKLEKNKEIDIYEGCFLKFSKYKIDNEIKDYLFLPEEWEIETIENMNIQINSLTDEFSILSNGLNKGDVFNFNKFDYELIEEIGLSTFIIQKIISLNSGDIHSEKPFKLIKIDDDFSDLTNFLVENDRTKTYQELIEFNNIHHAPMIFEKLRTQEEMVKLYVSLLKDKDIVYFSGFEKTYDPKLNYQISVISLIYLASLNLLDIIEGFDNLYFETTQIATFENILNKELENENEGNLYVSEGKLGVIKQSPEDIMYDRSLLKSLLLSSKKIKKNRSGIINKSLRELNLFDSVSIQSAITNNINIIYDDESIQTILQEKFNIEGGSVGSIISFHFLEKERDIVGFFDILIHVLKVKTAWVLSRETLLKMYSLMYKSDMEVIKKYEIWIALYLEYFQIL